MKSRNRIIKVGNYWAYQGKKGKKYKSKKEMQDEKKKIKMLHYIWSKSYFSKMPNTHHYCWTLKSEFSRTAVNWMLRTLNIHSYVSMTEAEKNKLETEITTKLKQYV